MADEEMLPFDPSMKKKKKKKKTGFDPDAVEDAPADTPTEDAVVEEKSGDTEPVQDKPVDEGLYLQEDIDGKQNVRTIWRATCPVCQKSISTISNMIRHMETVHTLPKENQHRCHLCGLTCKTLDVLTQHKKSHQIICEDCGKVYSSVSSLNVHARKMHSGIKYPCLKEKCTFVANSQDALDFHLNTHNGVKPYKCKHCKKSYSRKDACSRHQMQCVSGATCEICGAKFKLKVSLVEHVRAKHRKERFHCLCGSAFKYKPNLRRHQKISGHILPNKEFPLDVEYIAESL